MANPSIRILVLGSSHVNHLRDFLRSRNFLSFPGASAQAASNLNLNNCEVRFLGISGGRAAELGSNPRVIAEVNNWRPHVVFLQIGGNDLSPSSSSSLNVSYIISEFADSLIHSMGVRHVVVGQIPLRMRIDPGYNTRVYRANQYLRNFCETAQGVRYWRHRGVVRSMNDIFARDGVHLNHLGYFKLYRSVRAVARTVIRQILMTTGL